MSRWRPMKAPKLGATTLLLYVPGYGVTTGFYSRLYRAWCFGDFLESECQTAAPPSHWQPLPKPPSVKQFRKEFVRKQAKKG